MRFRLLVGPFPAQLPVERGDSAVQIAWSVTSKSVRTIKGG